ncbi:MAG TPA: FAD-binding oxidoreductase [Gemmatimonadales bacterium]|nr:FAD-binding oxidoreductase [Gemmatimonadales bacterium]
MILQDWWYTTLLAIRTELCPPLREHLEVDTLVVGAGMAGLMAAHRLAAAGRRVAVMDRNICGGSSTGKSAGFLTPDSELELSQIVRRYGRDRARDLWDAPVRGIELIRAAAREHDITCDLLKADSLYVGNGTSGWRAAREEVDARRELGYPQRQYSAAELPSVLGSGAYAGGVRYPDCYGINALLFAQGMKRALLAAGVRVFESTEALRLDGHTVHTHLGSVTADEILFCIDKVDPALTPYAADIFHAQTFLAISEPLGDADVRRLFPEEPLQCWDSDLVYSYWRLTGDQRLLLGGGSALTTFALHTVTSKRVILRVIRDFKARFPFLHRLNFIQYWPGLIDTTRDLLPTVLRDERLPWVHWVLGCVGLPWAAFCGDFAARNVLGTAGEDDARYYRYFSAQRPFFLPLWTERLLGKPLVFSLNNGWAKYYQVDRHVRMAEQAREF